MKFSNIQVTSMLLPTLGRKASTGWKPEWNPTLSTPVNSYGIQGNPYSALTTEWFGGKNWNSEL